MDKTHYSHLKEFLNKSLLVILNSRIRNQNSQNGNHRVNNKVTIC
jgi:hypothetical protein